MNDDLFTPKAKKGQPVKGRPEKLTKSPHKTRYTSRAKKAMLEKAKTRAANKALERCRDAGVVV